MDMKCFFCGGSDGVKGITCLACGKHPKIAAAQLLNRVRDIAAGPPSAGFNYAVDILLKELNDR